MVESVVIIIFISNLIVGVLLGMSSIGGFLLPLIYVGFLQLPLRESLALSFLSYAVAGIIGSYSYWKAKNIDVKLAMVISVGSIPGSFIGVQLNFLIPDQLAKLVMYLFVLLSGLSLLIKRKEREDSQGRHKSKLLKNKISIFIIGLIIAAVCALTGAGGPILLVPLITSLGLNIRVAVGVGLFNSVIIAIPSVFGYFQHTNMDEIALLIVASVVGQIIGITNGTFLANKIKIDHLLYLIASITIVTSLYMLVTLFR